MGSNPTQDGFSPPRAVFEKLSWVYIFAFACLSRVCEKMTGQGEPGDMMVDVG